MTEPRLRTRYIFVDTQSFCQQRLKFDHPTLKRFRELCASRMLQLIVTETVVGEVKNKITEQLTSAVNNLSNFHKEAAILEGFATEKFPGLFVRPNPEDFIAEGCNVWETFLIDTNATIVAASVVDTTKLLGMYFNSKPPFGNAKKKSEFPDAISTLSLEHWAYEKKQKIYIISGDTDFSEWSKGHSFAIYIKSLAEFIDLYNRTEEKLTTLAHSLFEAEEEWICDVVKESFLECGFEYADNWEAEIVDVEIVSFQIDDVNVIEVDENRALIAVEVAIDFSADVVGPDYDSAIWDSEDKEYAYVPTFSSTKTFSERFDVSFEIVFSLEMDEITEIREILFDDRRDITLYDDDYRYK